MARIFFPHLRRVSTQNLNNLQLFINNSVDDRFFSILGDNVIAGGKIIVNTGDNTKFDLVEDTLALIDGKKVFSPATAAITPSGSASTRFVIFRYKEGQAKPVTINAIVHFLQRKDSFELLVRDTDAGASEIRLAKFNMTGSTITSIEQQIDFIKPDTRYKRNKRDPGIVNGNLTSWQENTSLVGPASGTYFADILRYEKNGVQVHDIIRDTDLASVDEGLRPGTRFNGKIDVTTINATPAAGDFTRFSYNMEGLHLADYFGQEFTISFLVKSNKTGIYNIAFQNAALSKSYVDEFEILLANKWEEKIITVVHDGLGIWNLDELLGMKISWNLSTGTNFHTTKKIWQAGNFTGTAAAVNFDDNVANEFRIEQLNLNLGPVEKVNQLDDEAEFMRIQRFFSIDDNIIWGFRKTGVNHFWIFNNIYHTEMRAIPTITLFNIVFTGDLINAQVKEPTTRRFTIQVETNSGTNEDASFRVSARRDARF